MVSNLTIYVQRDYKTLSTKVAIILICLVYIMPMFIEQDGFKSVKLDLFLWKCIL